MEYININYDVVCRWEHGPFPMNALKSVHGTPALRHSEDDGVVSYFVEFPDKATVVLDKSVVNSIINSSDNDWLRSIENIMSYREVATNYVGYYAYCNIDNSNVIEANELFFLSKQLRLNIILPIVKTIGYDIQKNGTTEIICVNNDFIFSDGSLYHLIESDTNIMVEMENKFNPDGCTGDRLAEILSMEKYSLIRHFPNTNNPIIRIDKVLTTICGEKFNINPIVKSINAYAFYKNMMIEKIVIPNEIEEISDKAFACCGRLQEVEFTGDVNKVHQDAFAYSAIVNIVIPNGSTNHFKNKMPQFANRFIEKNSYVPLPFNSSLQLKEKTKNSHLFPVHFNNKTGFLNDNGDIVISALFTSVVGFFYDKESKIVAKSDNSWNIVDYFGKTTSINLDGKGKPVRLLDSKYLILEKGFNMHALYDLEEDRFIIEYGNYDYIWDYCSRYKAFRVRKGNHWGVIRADGAIILPVEYDKVYLGEDSYVYKDETGLQKKLYFINHDLYQLNCKPHSDYENWERNTWDAMTDGMYGDYKGGDDFEFMGE